MADVYIDEAVIINEQEAPVEVWFEPWGMPLSLVSGDSICVKATSKTAGSIEVVREEGLIAIYGWSECSTKVFHVDELILDLFELPDLGNGPSPRKVVESLFGGPDGPK
jgi:hypothetical protein